MNPLQYIFNHSLPSQLHIDEDKFLETQQSELVTSIRINPNKPQPIFENEEKIPWCENGRYLPSRPLFTANPLFHAGCFYVQEASSMFLEFALKNTVDLSKKITVLDLCAAPGGKTTLISSLLNKQSLLIANEVIPNRVNILNENVTKWGSANTWISNCDAKEFGKIKNYFDVMVIDAPCSGSGLFRRMPDYINEWTVENVNVCVERQKKILHDSYEALAQNGILIYMTCSFSKDENEDIVDYILQNFDVESIQLPINEKWNILETQSEDKSGFGYRFFSHLLKGEGFFLASFKKNEGQQKIEIPFKKVAQQQTHNTLLEKYIDTKNMVSIFKNDRLFFIHEEHYTHYHFLHNKIKLIKKGILAGQIIKNELIPDHELAMFDQLLKSVITVQLSDFEALQYLKKENITLENQPKGWLLMLYKNQALGWLKNIGNRTNNYYPNHYRILNKNILTNS